MLKIRLYRMVCLFSLFVIVADRCNTCSTSICGDFHLMTLIIGSSFLDFGYHFLVIYHWLNRVRVATTSLSWLMNAIVRSTKIMLKLHVLLRNFGPAASTSALVTPHLLRGMGEQH